MGTILERKLNDTDVNDMVKLCANKNTDAEKYLSDIAYVFRVFDDLIDKDYDVSDKQIYKSFFILMAGLWTNPFFIRNSRFLIALHIASFNAFADSNIWAEDDGKLKQVYAHVIKDFCNEIFGVVAFLTGGYNHMRKISLKAKEIFIEEI